MATWYQPLIEDPGVTVYQGLNLSKLERDQAYVRGNSSFDVVGLYSSAGDGCNKCPYKLIKTFHKEKEESWAVDTSIQYTWRFLNSADEPYRAYNNRSGLICELRPTLGEFGVYRVRIGTCILQPELKAVDIYTPLILTCAFVMVLGAVYSLFVLARTKFFKEVVSKAQKQEVTAERKTLALDIFQGLATILWLFFVCGAGGYYFLSRSWHGIFVEDVLVNAIAWGVGFSLPIFVHKCYDKTNNKLIVLWRITKLSLPLALLDVVLQSLTQQIFDVSLLWGPLERLAVAYLVTGYVHTVALQRLDNEREGFVKKIFADIRSVGGCVLLLCILYTAYTVLTFSLISYNNVLHIKSTLGNSSEKNMDAIHAIKIISGHDELITDLREIYIFQKGVLGLISTMIYVVFGVQAGSTLVLHDDHFSRMKRWVFWALNQTISGALLAIFVWHTNYSLWPVCFTLLSSAGFQLVFYVLYMITDIWNFWNDIPFYAVGRNALLIILVQTLCGNCLPLSWNIPLRTHFLLLLQNLWTIFFWLVICSFAIKKNVKISM